MGDEEPVDLLQRLKRLFSRNHLLGPGDGSVLERVRLIGVDPEWIYLMRFKAKGVKRAIDLHDLDSFAGAASGDLWQHAGCQIGHRDELELSIEKEWGGCPGLSADKRFRMLVIRLRTHANMIFTHSVRIPDAYQEMRAKNLDYIKRIESAYRNALVPVAWDGNRETGVLICKKMSLDIFK